MPTSSTDGTGQVPPTPQSPDSNGQVPPVSQGSSSGDGSDSNGASEQDMTPAEYRDALKKARADAAKYRVDSKELESLRAYKQQADDAKLSSDEKRDKALADAQERASAAEVRAQQVAVRAEVKLLASTLGIKTELALRLIDFAEIEFDDSGDPTNVAKLLEKAVADYGLAPASPAAGSNGHSGSTNGNGRAAQPTSIGSNPANPSRSASSGAPAGGWSWDAISSLSPADYEALSPAQRSAMAQFIMTHPQARGR